MSSNDALERLKKRSRPTVPSRDASLLPSTAVPTTPDITSPSSVDTSISRYQGNSASASPDMLEPQYQDAKNLVNQTPAAGISLSQEAQASNTLDTIQSLETKQSTLRLEKGVSDRLQSLCRQQDICREVLIEAMFEYCEAHPDALTAVLSEAGIKDDRRQKIANLKRAQSMMQRFGQSG